MTLESHPGYGAAQRPERPGRGLAIACGLVSCVIVVIFILAGNEPNMFGALLLVVVAPVANLLMFVLGLATIGRWGTGRAHWFYRYEAFVYFLFCLAVTVALFEASRVRYGPVG